MAKVLKKVDVVTIGAGWTGGIIAAELTKQGIEVLSLERGNMRGLDNFAMIHDEWRYGINYGLMQDCSKESVTIRHTPREVAVPMRKMGSFLLGSDVGGSGIHWNGWTFRFLPYDFQIKTLSAKRYGNKLGSDYTLEDWGITYKEMEPYYDKFEKMAGVSGEANPLEKSLGTFRSSPYPQGPLKDTKILKRFAKAAKACGLHPYRVPASISGDSYTNPDGQDLSPCAYCAFCERFACEYNSKAMPVNTVIPKAMASGKYSIRTQANVVQILKKGNKVTGVKFIDTKTMEEYIQPADIVVLSSYMLNNAKLLMVSKIGVQYDPKTGKGTLGRNYCYQMNSATLAFFDEQFNTFAGAGALGTTCDDFNGDNFDHSNVKFLHGAMIAVLQMGNRPIQLQNNVPAGTPTWGAAYKKALNYNYTRNMNVYAQGASLPHKNNYLDLDPTYKDAYGLPLLRMTYNFTPQDRELQKYFVDKCAEVALKLDGVKSIRKGAYIKDYSIVPYQSTHNTGGTTMGYSPHTSVVNNYLQHWHASNLFVVGAGNFQNNSGYNPTDTAGALAYRAAEGILKYRTNPRNLG